jgi:single-stranded-DNA-specific exonuclease
MLESQWGQGFPPPLFCDSFPCKQRIVGERHLRLRL